MKGSRNSAFGLEYFGIGGDVVDESYGIFLLVFLLSHTTIY